ncbi:OsmC family protein [Ramlibacter sp.]|uniref:OsmC family protein n=1 Tax=Ramlibacter sp. TaxID=1917967 RepID=UPI0035ADDDBB
MHPYPHRYTVQASAGTSGPVACDSAGLPRLETTPPPEFDGPPGYWSPETLLIAAIADCYVLSFRAVARASKLEWERLEVDVEGVLEKTETGTRFTHYTVKPRLTLADPAREALARTVLDKSKRACLVTNSLNGVCDLAPELVFTAAA